MLDEYLKKGKLSYYKNICKSSQMSKDIFKVDYYAETIYLLCTFEGLVITNVTIVSGDGFY